MKNTQNRVNFDVKEKEKIFAIIVTYQGSPWIEECIRSLKNSDIPIKIIVVDNGSTDQTVSIVSKIEGTICLPQHINLGFGRANNIGINYALNNDADFVFLLNQDALIRNDTIEQLINMSKKNKDYGILSPVHLNGKGDKIDNNFIQYITQAGGDLFSDLFISRNLKEIYEVFFVNAAAWLINRTCIEIVGGFDPLFFMYSEDQDYCNRVINAGLKIGVVPSAVALHKRKHAEEINNHFWRNFRRQSLRYRSSMIAYLKVPKRSLYGRFFGLILEVIRWLTWQLGSGNLIGILAIITAFFITIIYLPKIHAHRQMSKSKNRNWLANIHQYLK